MDKAMSYYSESTVLSPIPNPCSVACLSVQHGSPRLRRYRQQILEFRADILIVIGDDRLHSQLELFAKSQPRQPAVIKLVKSGGVITRSPTSRAIGQSNRIREYFYGVNNELSPSSNVLDLTAIKVNIFLSHTRRLE